MQRVAHCGRWCIEGAIRLFMSTHSSVAPPRVSICETARSRALLAMQSLTNAAGIARKISERFLVTARFADLADFVGVANL